MPSKTTATTKLYVQNNPLAQRAIQADPRVLQMLESYIQTPAGGWGQTDQAYRELLGQVRVAAGWPSRSDAAEAIQAMERAAISAGWSAHPTR